MAFFEIILSNILVLKKKIGFEKIKVTTNSGLLPNLSPVYVIKNFYKFHDKKLKYISYNNQNLYKIYLNNLLHL